ncbi:MAG: tRNA (adenosine(37)-N6)-dimethylallyltransferase MiaA [Patescibacteria group bacterium]
MVPLENVICIVGPTSSGKTGLSLDLAEAFHGEVVSGDARQVYRGLDLGTGKIKPNETRGIPHHLTDVADPKVVYTASDFIEDGGRALRDIRERSHIPFVVGGSGFYIDALLGRLLLASVVPNQELRAELEQQPLEVLQKMLRKMNPARFETVDQKNPRRLVRALEIAHASPTHRKLSPKASTLQPTTYNLLWIGLTLPREELKKNIAERLRERMNDGMVKEAHTLHQGGLSYERMETLGLEYRALAKLLKGEITEKEMEENLRRDIYRYAKRQMTWFKKNKDIQWFHPKEDYSRIYKECETFLKKSEEESGLQKSQPTEAKK